jgi:hypothetical protein
MIRFVRVPIAGPGAPKGSFWLGMRNADCGLRNAECGLQNNGFTRLRSSGFDFLHFVFCILHFSFCIFHFAFFILYYASAQLSKYSFIFINSFSHSRFELGSLPGGWNFEHADDGTVSISN